MSGQARLDESMESFLSSISSNDKKLTEKLQGILELSKKIQLDATEEARELRSLCEVLMNEVREQNARIEDAIMERDEYKSLADSLMQVRPDNQKLNAGEAGGVQDEELARRRRREEEWKEEKSHLIKHIDNVELSMDKLKLEFSRSLEFYQNHIKKVSRLYRARSLAPARTRPGERGAGQGPAERKRASVRARCLDGRHQRPAAEVLPEPQAAVQHRHLQAEQTRERKLEGHFRRYRFPTQPRQGLRQPRQQDRRRPLLRGPSRRGTLRSSSAWTASTGKPTNSSG